MQGLQHQQQHLVALLAAALPKDASASHLTTPPLTAAAPPVVTAPNAGEIGGKSDNGGSGGGDSARLVALNSLHRAITYPPNSILVAHSAAFLAPGLSQLLSDKSFFVRQAAAIAYGALCAVVCSIPIGSSGRQNHVMLGSLVERFVNWALPLLSNVNGRERATELAVQGLREFLTVGDVDGIERYALPILKACQELLEDERTSMSLLHRLLDVLSLISSKFSRVFHPHFLDIVDLLLGWALVPDLSPPDRQVIMDSFLQFQKHWVQNLDFSMGLLSKFLSDMDVLLQVGSQGTPQHFRRLLALLSCFSTILRSTASGLLENNLLDHISESLSKMLPRLLECLSMVGQKFGWSKWVEELWKCLTLLAEILCEKFSVFYPQCVDILFNSFELDGTVITIHGGRIHCSHVHGTLKTNLQLLSLQKLGLLPSSVQKILHFDAPVSQLRLHPNHSVTAASAATYIFLLQHEDADVVQQAVTSLMDEVVLLKGLLGTKMACGHELHHVANFRSYSKLELCTLIKFDLKVLLTCVSLGERTNLEVQPELAALYLKRSDKLVSFIVEKLNPYDLPIDACLGLKVDVIKALERLAAVEFVSQWSIIYQSESKPHVDVAMAKSLPVSSSGYEFSNTVVEHVKKYSSFMIRSLNLNSPLTLKLISLEWVERFCENLILMQERSCEHANFYNNFASGGILRNMVLSILDAAFDREPKVRSSAAVVLELLLVGKLIPSIDFLSIADAVLERLGDPDIDIRNSFVRLLSHVLPAAVYASGLGELEEHVALRPNVLMLGNGSNLSWKQVFALKQLDQKFHSQQLVSVLNYISQRLKVPFSFWIQRLIGACQSSNESVVGPLEETRSCGAIDGWLNIKDFDDAVRRICSVNNLAGSWWAIHEAARFCVVTRLRTNFGGAAQTFAALERMLLDIVHVLQLDSEQTDGNLNIIGSSDAHLLPMRLLLDFVEALKKNVYNAYEGSAVLPSAPRQCVMFFRANKKVCEEWFSRIHEPMVNASLALHCRDATIEYCTLRLEELKGLASFGLKEKSAVHVADSLPNSRIRLMGDILRILRHMSLALCRNHEAEALCGLQKWVSVTFCPFLVREYHSQNHKGTLGIFSWITGLMFQARGQYEKAAAYFVGLLQDDDSLSLMGSDGVQFAIARIIESYTAVSDWKSLDSWLLELQTLRATHVGKSFSGSLTTTGNEINAIQALAHFDEGDTQGAWTCLDLTPKTSSRFTLDPKLALQRSEQMLLQALLLKVEGNFKELPHVLQKAKSVLDETLSILSVDGLGDAAPYAAQLHSIFAFQENHHLEEAKPIRKHGHAILSSAIKSLPSLMEGVYQDCSPWLKILRVYRTILPTSSVTLKLGMDLFRSARKQGNLLLANRLKGYLADCVSSCSDMTFRDLLILNMEYQGILLMYSEERVEHAIMDLWSFVRPHVVASELVVSDSNVSVLKAKACLKLSSWLRGDYSRLYLDNILLKISADVRKADSSSSKSSEPFFSDKNLNIENSAGAIIEEVIGTATKSATQLCSAMGKTWISYASWCFRQAKNTVINPHESNLTSCTFSKLLVEELTPERFKLTEEELKHVESVILKFVRKDVAKGLVGTEEMTNFGINSSEKLKVENAGEVLVQEVVSILEAAAAVPGDENSGGNGLSTALASQLTACLYCADKKVEDSDLMSVVDKLVEVWWSLRKRRVSLFGHAAFGFIQYLSYASTKPCNPQFSIVDPELLRQKSSTYTLRATLYVLHVLLNYGVELKDTLEPALSKVPLSPWQEVTPQLFARLSSHPEEVVRKQLKGLLMMLAKSSPWSIVYPMLVDVNACEDTSSEELLHLHRCLSELYPRLVQDSQLLIKELGNVTVLWEELWLSTLQDLHMDVIRRINLLKDEASRIAANTTLSQSEKKKINAAKYSAMMAPIVVALERRLASTSRKPETPHEVWFHQQYMERLKSAVLNFKTPPGSAAALGEVWRPFDNIAASLASYQRKSSISLKEVAPSLALLSSSDVPMPGLDKEVCLSEFDTCMGTTVQGIITVSSIADEVTVISTKTRPRKLILRGSNGKRYTYLLKGREDLRLDARIMQLLRAVNSFLLSSPTTCANSIGIRYYSVTPISGRAGLIQWVENVTSIYSIFKSWQSRIQGQSSASASENANSTAPTRVPRPSDMFYGKIIPALKEKGIKRVISRRDWPLEVKREVLLDLMKEVPKQLLHQELWCASEGFKAFGAKLKRYSGSVAAMSIFGHVLGLGDRHLDNILLDLCNGDIVHIDYNVCFDKGYRLKVPEIVPFRLTQTMEAALGLTGIEGIFRANCEAVLGVLRSNKDLLLMLLEVFVWDPLVEWTRGDFHDDSAIGGEERKGMELAVSLSLFASRVQEIRIPLQEHHDLLVATLPSVESALERFSEVLNQYELASTLFYQVGQERSKLTLHETSAKKMVAEAACNSERTRASFEIQAREFAQAKAIVSEKAQETTTWMEQHKRVLDALWKNLVPEITASMNMKHEMDAFSLTSAVTVAGVPLTVVPEPTQAQCHDIDGEVRRLTTELDSGISSALSSLQVYSLALQRILPLNYYTTSSVYGWTQVLQLSARALSSDVIAVSRRQAGELIAKLRVDNVDATRNSYDDLCLKAQKLITEIKKVEDEYSELVNTVDPEAESRSKDRVLHGFLNYMQSSNLLRKEYLTSAGKSGKSGKSKYDVTKGSKFQDSEEGKEKVLAFLHIALSSMYDQVKQKLYNIISSTTRGRDRIGKLQPDIVRDFEDLVEECYLLVGFVNEIKHIIGWNASSRDATMKSLAYNSYENWPSIFQQSLSSFKNLVAQMTEVVLPNVMRTIVLSDSEVMDAYGFISQLRGSIDMALEHLLEITIERESLVDLEQNYFVKVGLITEKQLALEEAALKGRDHLSWEEAEELASQEETCRAQLDHLHETWNHRDFQVSSLTKKEADIENRLVSAELQFESLTTGEELKEPLVQGNNELLVEIIKPFAELESLDKIISSLGSPVALDLDQKPNLEDIISSGNSFSAHIWSFGSSLHRHSFFIWKVSIITSFLDSCIHDASSSIDQKLGFEQLISLVKKNLALQLQERINFYLRERVAPALFSWLENEIDRLKHMSDEVKQFMADQAGKDTVKRVQALLEEYCNAHETARAAKSAASLMKRQLDELREALSRTSLDIIQMEWMYDATLAPSNGFRTMFQDFVTGDNRLYPSILNLRRSKLLETLQSAVKKIPRSMEGLQACEQNSLAAEGQLERAMTWACGGPSSGATGQSLDKASGIPHEFHEHLIRRRQLMQDTREKASNIVKLCMSLLEFEASREGLFRSPGDAFGPRASSDGRLWQQACFNALMKFEVAYHSFTRVEQEWKHAQSSMEAASNGLYSATDELCNFSLKAKSASGDLRHTVLAMRDNAYEASVALSAFSRASRNHTALTSEAGSMLEEVLAITEDLHDVHSLGKEAAAIHHSLMEDLSKANTILVPLDSMLSKDVAAMTDAITRERDTNMEVYSIHGQAIYQSYCARIREACQNLKPLIPPIMSSVEGLYTILTKLARAASLHAGNLNKALQGLGGSDEEKSQGSGSSMPDLSGDGSESDDQQEENLSASDSENSKEILSITEPSSDIRGWMSPPDSVYSSSSGSVITTTDTSSCDSSNNSQQLLEQSSFDPQERKLLNISSSLVQSDSHDTSKSGLSLSSQEVVNENDGSNSINSSSVDDLAVNVKLVLQTCKEASQDPAHPSQHFDEKLELKSGEKDANKGTGEVVESHEGSPSQSQTRTRVNRGKNAYALSVLRRVEMKLDGRDIADNREMNIADQVDYLIKQATSVDNLCNMYEGWTPWI